MSNQRDLLPENITVLDAGAGPLTLSMVIWLIAAIEKNGHASVFNVHKPEPNQGLLQNAETLAQKLFRLEMLGE